MRAIHRKSASRRSQIPERLREFSCPTHCLFCAPVPDGILDTADDTSCLTASGAVCPNGGVECLTEPGPDGILGTADDVIVSLNNYTRTVAITPLLEAGTTDPTLVQVSITINYTVPNSGHTKSYTLVDYISAYH